MNLCLNNIQVSGLDTHLNTQDKALSETKQMFFDLKEQNNKIIKLLEGLTSAYKNT